ncbi:MAG: hypothetical protein ACKOSQ_00060 [Planctomycetaceae bacterium]
MASPTAPQLDAAAVRTLVEEVLRRITAGQSGAPTGAAAPSAPAAAASAVATITDTVITLAHVERLPPGIRHVAVAARAVITPSARDHAREAGITIVRATGGGAGVLASAATRPFVIGQADCRGDAAARAAAIARAVPHAQRLPTTGLADVVSALALHASRDAARCVLLTSRPALAVIVANRSSSLRAVTGRDATTLATAAADCGANLLVLDPAAFAGGLERVCADFAGRAAAAIPAELAQAPSGCACTGHPH